MLYCLTAYVFEYPDVIKKMNYLFETFHNNNV